MTSTVTWRGGSAAGLLLVAVVALGVLWPLHAAGYVDDDWGWLALSRHLENPLPAFWNNVLWGYFWRPMPLLVDWALSLVVDASATPRYAFSALQHALAAALVALLVHTATRSRGAALTAGMLAATLPALTSLPMWLSNRNELLVVDFGLAALLLLERGLVRQHRIGGRRALAIALLLMAALASKETAYVVALALALRTLLAWRAIDRASFARMVAAIGVPVALALVARTLTVAQFAGTVDGGDPAQVAVRGIEVWFALLPRALGGFQEAAWRGTAACMLLALPVLLLALPRLRAAHPSSAGVASAAAGPLLAIGALLLVLPALVQWPVTGHVLVAEGALRAAANQRFFALSSIGAVLLCAGALSLLRARRIVAALLLPLVLGAAQASWTQLRAWAAMGAAATARAETAADAVTARLRRDAPSPCVVDVSTQHLAPGFADSIVKARLERGSPLLDCAVFVDGQAAWYGFARAAHCDAASMAPAVLNPDGPVLAFGGLCQRLYSLPAAARDDPRVTRISLE